MKRFSFSLEKVQNLKEFKKKQAEMELGKALQEEAKIQNTLDMLAQKKIDTIKAADEMKDIHSLYSVQHYFALLDERKEIALEELTRAKVLTDEKRAAMEQTMREVKAIENFKELKKAEWKKQQLQEEENAIDEIVTSKYNRTVDTTEMQDGYK